MASASSRRTNDNIGLIRYRSSPLDRLSCVCVENPRLRPYAPGRAKALRMAFGEEGPVDLKALATIAFSADDDASVGLARKFMAMICKGYKTNGEAARGSEHKICAWELPLIGIHNILDRALFCENELDRAKATAIVDYIRSQWREIVRVVHRDIAELHPANDHAAHMRFIVVETLGLIGNCGTIRDQLRDKKTVNLYLTCWTHTPVLERQKINAMLRRFCKLQESNDLVDLPADWNRWAVDIIGSEALLRRYEEWLSDDNLEMLDLLSELELMDALLFGPNGYTHPIVGRSLLQHIFAAVERHYGSKYCLMCPAEWDQTWDKGLDMLIKICNSDPHRTVERVTDLLNLGVLQSVIHILFIHLDSRADRASWKGIVYTRDVGPYGYQAFLELVERIASGRDGWDRHLHTPAFMVALRTPFEFFYVSTLRRLIRTSHRVGIASVHEVWQKIAAHLGITEQSMRDKWSLNWDCCYALCQDRHHKTKQTRRCRCGKTSYCSISCCIRDWDDEHKLQCNQSRPSWTVTSMY